MLSPHSTLGQTELKGRGGWGTLELKPSMLFSGLQMGSRCPGPLTLRLPCKGNTFLSQLLGLRSQQLPESRGGGAPPSGPPTARGGCQAREGQREGTPSTLHESWHARGMDGSEPPGPHPTSDTKKSLLAAWHGLLSSNGNDNEGWVVATWVLHTYFTGIDNLLATL